MPHKILNSLVVVRAFRWGLLQNYSNFYFILRSLYFQSIYHLCQTGSSDIRRKPCQCALHFNEQITKPHFLQLQPVETSYSSSYFTVERAPGTLHRMSPCIPISVPVKISWRSKLNDTYLINETLHYCYWCDKYSMKCEEHVIRLYWNYITTKLFKIFILGKEKKLRF